MVIHELLLFSAPKTDVFQTFTQRSQMSTWLNTTTLEGTLVTMKPLGTEHAAGLAEAVSDGKLWELWYTSTPTPDSVESYIHKALQDYESGVALPFAIVSRETKKVIGTTRFINAVPAHRRVEIGYTWYAKSHQRTGVNTECKYLLLRYAFESLGCIAVEFRTHWHNIQSRNAIARLGAKQDGVLRNHQIDEHGCLRDTVVFSIIDSEWKTVKTSLEFKMRKNYNS